MLPLGVWAAEGVWLPAAVVTKGDQSIGDPSLIKGLSPAAGVLPAVAGGLRARCALLFAVMGVTEGVP